MEKTNIVSLQEMLRYLSFVRGDESLRVDVTGNYDSATEMAVRSFQAAAGLPITGVVDNATWDEIARDYSFERAMRTPVLLRPIPDDPEYRNRPGERSDEVLMLQVVLGALRELYDYQPVPLSGVYGGATEEAVRRVQEISGLSPTGAADRETWLRLAEDYNAR